MVAFGLRPSFLWVVLLLLLVFVWIGTHICPGDVHFCPTLGCWCRFLVLPPCAGSCAETVGLFLSSFSFTHRTEPLSIIGHIRGKKSWVAATWHAWTSMRSRKISRTLQDQSPTDCCAANISLHRFVALIALSDGVGKVLSVKILPGIALRDQ